MTRFYPHAFVCLMGALVLAMPSAGVQADAYGPTPVLEVNKLTQAEVRKVVKPTMKGSMRIAYPPFRGPFGNASSSILVLVRNDEPKPARFVGYVIAPEGATNRVYELPVLHAAGVPVAIDSVLFEDINHDRTLEIVILARYLKERAANQPVGKPYSENVVLRMKGEGYERWQEAEAHIRLARTPAQARKALTPLVQRTP